MNELPDDGLDPLLRTWHDRNAARARELREATLAAAARPPERATRRIGTWLRGGLAAAAAIAITATLSFLVPFGTGEALASGMALLPEGGRLDARDRRGMLIGPCPLARTEVEASVSGPFARVALLQRFRNPYPQPIEATYVFPLPERAAVDGMRMTVRDAQGERIVEGVVRERTAARQTYEAARAQGFVAGILEQERPNVFTQGVANIAPGAEVDVRISYVETLAARDGTYEFAFPMTVGPRYVPGLPTSEDPPAPVGWERVQRVVLLGPARVTLLPQDDPTRAASLQDELSRAWAIEPMAGAAQPQDLSTPESAFTVSYADGSQEPGELFPCGIGRVGGRTFALPSGRSAGGAGAVPDAARITPMPVRPENRAGHDISVRLDLDAGGIPVEEAVSVLHGVDVRWDGNARASFSLQGADTIPNRDFVLRWRLKDDAILEGTFAHAVPAEAGADVADRAPVPQVDGYLTLVVNPPARAVPERALPRELVFVMDTSGSMGGFPIEKSRDLMRRVLASMRPGDTFNVVTFAGSTQVLWDRLRPATADNVGEAMRLVDASTSGGGTEMMKAIEAALVRMPRGPSAPRPDGTVSVPPNTPVRPAGNAAPGPDAAAGAPDPEPLRIAVFLTDGFVGNDQGIVAAIRANAGSTRVFSLGIGNSVNRWLVDAMAQAGRGASEVVLQADDADAAVARLVRRMETPLLADIRVSAEGIELADVVSGSIDVSRSGLVPDLFDARPLVLHARYSRAGQGTVVLRGRTVAGPWERRIPVTAVASGRDHPMLPQLWARSRVDAVLAPHLQEVEQQSLPRDVRAQVVRLGERYRIVTPYTSFVAVERSRVVSNGRPLLVTVPVELPEGTRFEGLFGECWSNPAVEFAVRRAMGTDAEAAPAGAQADASAAPSAETLRRTARPAAPATASGPGGAPSPAMPPIGGGGGFGGGLRMRDAGEPAGKAASAAAASVAARPADGATADARQDASDPGPRPAPGVPGRPLQDGSVVYRVQRGDTLSAVAERAYGKSDGWRRVLAANERQLKGNERAIREGMELILPGPVRLSGKAEEPGTLPREALDRLARVLDRRLLAILLHSRLPDEEKAKLPPLERELARLSSRGAIPVLVRATARAALAPMEASGVPVQWCELPAGKAGVLAIVAVPVGRLQELALGEGVVAVAPFEALGAAESLPVRGAGTPTIPP